MIFILVVMQLSPWFFTFAPVSFGDPIQRPMPLLFPLSPFLPAMVWRKGRRRNAMVWLGAISLESVPDC